MAAVTICVEPGELQSLRALAELDAVTNERQPDLPGVAAALMRRALAASLRERGLAPPATPEAGRSIAAASAEPDSAVPVPRTRDRTRKYAASALAAAVLILLWGGYARGWGWTGFRANGQLWDWMSLLLLPVVVGILPLWIEHAGDVGRTKHVTALAALAAFAAFAAAGYLVPLHWTGFRSQTLWDWFGLLLLPAALVIAPMLPKHVRSVRPGQKWVIVILIMGWTVTIVGGYALSWKWTGYPGSTLWDWLRLLLLPLIVPTLLIPGLFSRISGPGAQPDQEAKAASRRGAGLTLDPSPEPAAGRPASAFPPFPPFPAACAAGQESGIRLDRGRHGH
jgi:uncharacterized membrane protein